MGARHRSDDELLNQAEANGYEWGAHEKQDQIRGEKHNDKTTKDQDGPLTATWVLQLDEHF